MNKKTYLKYENKYYKQGFNLIAGVDEAGRGCLLGPVVAAAVILPKNFHCCYINDSKQLTKKQREKAYEIILKNAISWSVEAVSAEEIDKINILNASRLAMQKALNSLNIKPDFLLSDAMEFYDLNIKYESLIHGDAKSQCIAAASIIAKVTRDRICEELDKKYPDYQISKHKGYCTKLHLEILKKNGPIKGLYRYSYKPVKEFDKISLF